MIQISTAVIAITAVEAPLLHLHPLAMALALTGPGVQLVTAILRPSSRRKHRKPARLRRSRVRRR